MENMAFYDFITLVTS